MFTPVFSRGENQGLLTNISVDSHNTGTILWFCYSDGIRECVQSQVQRSKICKSDREPSECGRYPSAPIFRISYPQPADETYRATIASAFLNPQYPKSSERLRVWVNFRWIWPQPRATPTQADPFTELER